MIEHIDELLITEIKFLLDLAKDSMNFGSGFLDTEEVDRLRLMAITIDLDPWNYTPQSQGRNYPHVHDERYIPEYCEKCECDFSGVYKNPIANCEHLEKLCK